MRGCYKRTPRVEGRSEEEGREQGKKEQGKIKPAQPSPPRCARFCGRLRVSLDKNLGRTWRKDARKRRGRLWELLLVCACTAKQASELCCSDCLSSFAYLLILPSWIRVSRIWDASAPPRVRGPRQRLLCVSFREGKRRRTTRNKNAMREAGTERMEGECSGPASGWKGQRQSQRKIRNEKEGGRGDNAA